MSNNKLKECGDKNSENRKEKLKGLAEIAGGMAIFAGSAVLYKASFDMSNTINFAGGISIGGVSGMTIGAGVAGHGAIRYIDASPKTQERLIRAYRNLKTAKIKMDDFTKERITPFVQKAMDNIKNRAEKTVAKVDKKGKLNDLFKTVKASLAQNG